MFGSIYFNHPDVLRQSMRHMNQRYRADKPRKLASALERLYIRVFGIPEIGLQIRALYFKRILGRLQPEMTRVLDAGSGIGAYSVMLAQRYPAAKVIGCDIDREKLFLATHLRDELGLNNLHFVRADITDLDRLGEPFDLIVSIDVLEHVTEYQDALVCFHRMLKPRGLLYVHAPQLNQTRILSRFNRWHHDGHVREGFRPDALAGELTNLGFTIVDIRETFGVVGKLAWELNHITLASSTWLAASAFPLLYLLARIDPIVRNSEGLGVSLIAQKTM